MKRLLVFRAVVLTGALLLISGSTFARGGGYGWGNRGMMGMGQGMMGPGMMCSGMMGPGMMCSGMMGPGMMGSRMMGPMMMGCGYPMMMGGGHGTMAHQGPWAELQFDAYGRLLEPLTKKQATEIGRFYVDWQGDPRLKVGKVSALDRAFEVQVVTKDNSLVYTLLIDKETATILPGPE